MYHGAPPIEERTPDTVRKHYYSKEARAAANALIAALGYDPKYVLDEHGGSHLCWDHDGALALRIADREEDGKVIFTSGGATIRTDYVHVPEDVLATYRAAIAAL